MDTRNPSSIWKIILTVVITAFVVGGVTFRFANKSNTGKTAKPTTANLVKYSLNGYSTPQTNINLQFELPYGYGAAMDQEGEGALVITFNIGKFIPENGTNVIQVTNSMPTHVKIFPSSDSKSTTLADYQKDFGLLPSDATKKADVTVAGVTASSYDVSGLVENHIIQFVKDNSFYEIGNGVGNDENVVAKIIATLTITK